MYKKAKRFIAMILIVIMICPSYVFAEPKIISISQGEPQTITVLHETHEYTTMNKVPLFNQGDYPDVPYGNHGTIASHGCGLVSMAMVLSYLNDTVYSPVELAKEFGDYNTEAGSYWALMTDAAVAYGVEPPIQTKKWEDVEQGLKNGSVVISIQHEGLFTTGGHFIVLTKITPDGKVMVNDPNGGNWQKTDELIEGFSNGFTAEQIHESSSNYWIYPVKK